MTTRHHDYVLTKGSFHISWGRNGNIVWSSTVQVQQDVIIGLRTDIYSLSTKLQPTFETRHSEAYNVVMS